MHIDISTLAPSQVYHLLTQTIIPRPIAWVLTDSGESNYNLAPFSYFTAISSQPPLLMFSAGNKPDGELKDTVRNVLETGKMVIHIASVDLAEKVTQTSATLAHGISETELAQLELIDVEGVDLPRLSACPIAFHCSLYEVKEIGDAPQHLVFAEIDRVYIDPKVILPREERLQINALDINPLCRLGGSEYAILDKTFSVVRPK